MGKKLGTAALFLGAFLLAFSALSKFYMYDQVAVVPLNNQSTSILATVPGADAEYLDVAAGVKVVKGPLKSIQLVTGDVKLSKQASKDTGRDVAVWSDYNCTDAPTFNCASGKTPLSATNDRVAFDVRTGEAVAWKGNKNDANGEVTSPMPYEGLFYKFPFDTQKKTYLWWDTTLKKATPAKYVGEGKVKGMKVYKFVQTIAPIKTGTLDVPGSLVGSDKATVTADQVYSDVRSFSIEPVTGAPLDVTDSQDTYLEVDGERKATLTKASLDMTDASTQALIDDYGSKVTQLKAVKTWIPVGGTVLGLVLIGLGVMSRRSGKSDGARRIDSGELVGSR
ncbi:MAG: hypothetical protein QOJ72_131 [Nocardioidaceae bacterium]|nr:hypothetical protein [Nocardioidaceae bacterium]